MGLILAFSEFWGRGLGVPSFYVLSTPFSVPELVWVIGPIYCGTGHVSELLGRVLG